MCRWVELPVAAAAAAAPGVLQQYDTAVLLFSYTIDVSWCGPCWGHIFCDVLVAFSTAQDSSATTAVVVDSAYSAAQCGSLLPQGILNLAGTLYTGVQSTTNHVEQPVLVLL